MLVVLGSWGGGGGGVEDGSPPRILDPIDKPLQNYDMPHMTSSDYEKYVAQDLMHALQHMCPASTLEKFGDNDIYSL